MGTSITLSQTEEKEVFLAAQYEFINDEWRGCYDEYDKSYEAGFIDEVRDINGDGYLDAVVTESSSFCYGKTGVAFTLVSKQASGKWKYITSATGYAGFLDSKGAKGWPDIEIGTGGFCFRVIRFNGENYKFNRMAYNGKPCEQ